MLAYIERAREAGRPDCAKRAAGVLAFGFEDVIRLKVAIRTPRGEVEDVTMTVLESMVHSSFEGRVIGEFRSFLNTVIARRVADFHRDRERHPDQVPLPGGGDDEEPWGVEPSVEDSAAELAILDLLRRVKASRNELHARVIELYAPGAMEGEELSAGEVVERIAAERDGEVVSTANVHQIWRRFKTDVERALSSDDGGPDG